MLFELPSQRYCGDLWLAHVEPAPLGGWKVDGAQRLLCWWSVDHGKPAKQSASQSQFQIQVLKDGKSHN